MSAPLKTQFLRWWRQIRRIRASRAHWPGLLLLAALLIGTLMSLPRTPQIHKAAAPAAFAVTLGGPFSLTGPNGAVVTDKSFPGKYLVVFFGYTFCPDICPTSLTSIAEALQKLGPLADRVQPLFITIDPKRDTPQVLRDYTAHFDPRIVGLSGTVDQIEHVEKAYKVYAAPYRTGNGPDDYLMDHTAIIYVMSPQGAFIGQLDHAATGAQMAHDLTSLVTQDTSGVTQ